MTLKVAELDKRSARAVDWGQALQTMHLRVVCFAYHRDEYHQLAHAGLSMRSTVEGDTAFIVAPIGQPPGAKLSIDAALAAAQILAAAQALHAACDCLMQVASWAMQLEHSASDSDECRRKSVFAQGNSRIELDQLRSSSAFAFLDGFVQASRWQNLLAARNRQQGKSRKRVEILIRDFERHREAQTCSFSARWASDFLYKDCDLIIEHCNRLGNAMASEIVC